MADSFRIQERQDIQAHPRRPARWVWLVGTALVFVVVAVGYSVWSSYTGGVAANPPAVLATPSPVPGVSPPAPVTTTGRAPQTTAPAGPQQR